MEGEEEEGEEEGDCILGNCKLKTCFRLDAWSGNDDVEDENESMRSGDQSTAT